MLDTTTNAVVAVVLGSVLAVLLLIPVAAVQYRRDGRLGPGDLAVLLGAAIYGLALWSYTLLPLPPEGTFFCQVPQLDPLASLDQIDTQGDGLVGLLRDMAFLQVALNVLFFVPLGYYVRRVLRRGVLGAAAVGLVTAVLIETTQLTGIWGIYDCAYRLFDVDDLVTNTVGAIIGSLASALVVDKDARPRPAPARITLGRRLVGMVCDLLFVVLAGALAAVLWRGWETAVLRTPLGEYDLDTQNLLLWAVPLALEAAAVLLLGRTVGEQVVSVRTTGRRGVLGVLARLVKLATGVGPLLLVLALGPHGLRYGLTVLPAFALLTVVAAARSRRNHRGLSHTLAGLDLVIATRPSVAPPPVHQAEDVPDEREPVGP